MKTKSKPTAKAAPKQPATLNMWLEEEVYSFVNSRTPDSLKLEQKDWELARRLVYKRVISQIERKLDLVDAFFKPLLPEGEEAFSCSSSLLRVEQAIKRESRSTLSKDKLLENGVDPLTIASSTVTTYYSKLLPIVDELEKEKKAMMKGEGK